MFQERQKNTKAMLRLFERKIDLKKQMKVA